MTQKLTLTERVDAAVREAAETKPRAAIAVLVVFGASFALNTVLFVLQVARGAVGQTASLLFFVGLFFVATMMMLAVVRRRPPGRTFWTWLLIGGALIALGPVLALANGGWSIEVYFPGRWGNGSEAPLYYSAPLLLALAAGMIVPGILGLARGKANARDEEVRQ